MIELNVYSEIKSLSGLRILLNTRHIVSVEEGSKDDDFGCCITTITTTGLQCYVMQTYTEVSEKIRRQKILKDAQRGNR